MAETTVIDTTAEVVEETTKPAPDIFEAVKCNKCGEAHFDACKGERAYPDLGFDPKDLHPEEACSYTIAAAIDWMKRPENDARIKSMVERAQQAEKTFVQAADREIGKVGRLLIDMGTSDDILEDFTASFLSSITGIGR